MNTKLHKNKIFLNEIKMKKRIKMKKILETDTA